MKIAIIGECMLELSHRSGGSFDNTLATALSFGGDTLNTAIYMSRLGVPVEYVTALGDDFMSDWMLDRWQSESVGCNLVQRHQNSVPGMYMIRTDTQGERSFLYWRENSPASCLLDNVEQAERLFESLIKSPYIYLSGITLGIYKPESLERLISFLEVYRLNGGQLIFDGNYRPKLWKDRATAQDIYARVYSLTSIALPTHSDECELFEEQTIEQTLERFSAYGIQELTIKMGGLGALVINGASSHMVKATEVNVIDTTAAGDSFNAAYLTARFNEFSPARAALSGHALASTVIQHPGAIIDAQSMPQNLAN